MITRSVFHQGVLDLIRRTCSPLTYKNADSMYKREYCNLVSRPVLYRLYHGSSVRRKKDYYEVLGLSRDATKSEVKKKYFELAKKYHPDVSNDPSASDKFREASEAYEVLEDEEKRKLYDNFGHAGVDPQTAGHSSTDNPFAGGFGGFGGFGPFGGNVQWEFRQGGQQVNGENINELFEELFGGRPRQRRGQGVDVRTALRLSFLEAISGCSKDIQVDIPARPSGGKSGGRQSVAKKVTLKIPRGVEDGVTLRVSGQGGEGEKGAPNGSLFVDLKVASDSYFSRDGLNINVVVPITVTQAILGGSVDVLTLSGMVELKVQPGTQPGHQVVLRGKGVVVDTDNGREARGHQYVTYQLQYPKNLNERQKQLLEEFDSEEKKKGKTESFSMESAWKRVKEFFGTDFKNEDEVAKGKKKEEAKT